MKLEQWIETLVLVLIGASVPLLLWFFLTQDIQQAIEFLL